MLHLLPPRPPFPPKSFTSAFFPEALRLPAFASLILASPPPEPTVLLAALAPSSYAERFHALLALELAHLSARAKSLVLFKLRLELVSATTGFVRVHVPGVREGWPNVSVGDECLLREVWLDLGHGSAEGLVGRVVSIGKREGYVYIDVPTLLPYLSSASHPFALTPAHFAPRGSSQPRSGPPTYQKLPHAYNCLFVPSPTGTLDQAACVQLAQDQLSGKPHPAAGDGAVEDEDVRRAQPLEGTDIVRRWLFPDEDDARCERVQVGAWLGDDDPKGGWLDASLNEEQRTAVRAVAMYRSPVPFLASGPFGTGKTKTIVEATLQILRLQPTATVLLVGPSNSATDTLCLRLRKALGARGDMLRLNDRERTFAEVPDEILPFCYTESTHFAVPPFAKLMRYRVVLTSTADAAILLRARVSNRDLGALETSTMGAIHPHAGRRPGVKPHWTHLLVDEAGQGSEPELLVPIAVVLPFEHTPPADEPQLVLCGDGQQLGPIVSSDAARNGELDVSLLERLFERPLYASSSAGVGWRPFVKLVKNYRCHPALLMTPSALFYNDTLQPHARNGAVRWTRLPRDSLPMVVFHSIGPESSVDEGASWFNANEINRVVDVVRSLLDPADSGLSTPPIQRGEIGVMAAYREQVWRIRERLRAEGFGAVDVGSVEDYQGREKRITIVSTFRSRARFLAQDRQKSLGLVFEQKRCFQRRDTRAKEALVIVGNANILARDPHWRGLLHFALRNDLFVGPKIDLQAGNDFMSSLESDYLAGLEGRWRPVEKAAERGDAEDEALALRLSGALARELLRETG